MRACSVNGITVLSVCLYRYELSHAEQDLGKDSHLDGFGRLNYQNGICL